ncbi:MAG: hypothetical protein AABW61_02800 [Candidatus Aenigmatarchaeota archaeon]
MPELKIAGKHEAEWVTISTDEYESMKSTIEVLADPELMEQLRKSKEDIKADRTKSWDDILKELKEKK